MLVKNVMLTNDQLITVSKNATLGEALKLMEEHNYLSLPVVEKERFYGLIAKDKIYEFCYKNKVAEEDLFKELTIEKLLNIDIPVIDPQEEIEKAVDHLAKKSVPFVAVVDEDKVFSGILTHKVVFEQFVEVFGMNKGERLAVIAYDIPGQLLKLSKIIADNDGDIMSFVVTDPHSVATDVKEMVLRVQATNMNKLVNKIKEAGFKVQ
jgi:acetoin utilization protein AcuB